jgi:hypothetical protein
MTGLVVGMMVSLVVGADGADSGLGPVAPVELVIGLTGMLG